MPDARERSSGAVLARKLRLRFVRAGIAANTIGALTVFAIAYLAPAPFDPDEEERVLVLNVATLVVVLAVSTPLLIALASRLVGRPLERWLHAERPATDEEREVALRLPMRLTSITAGLWGLGAIVFATANATVSPEMAVNAAIVVVLGGATTCAVCYLVAERLGRPLVARALGGRPPSRTVVPGVAARLTMTWVLVSGVPLVGIAAMAIADLSGVRLDEPTPALATLLLALVALLVGHHGGPVGRGSRACGARRDGSCGGRRSLHTRRGRRRQRGGAARGRIQQHGRGPRRARAPTRPVRPPRRP